MNKFVLAFLLLITFKQLLFAQAANLTITLSVLNSNTYNGPINMGVNMGHSSLNGNWIKFVQRLGINSARLFVAPVSDLRNFIGTAAWGKSLNGNLVTNQAGFVAAVADLRSANGRNVTYNWTNPVRWAEILDDINIVTQTIYGTDENTINKLRSLNINTLVVEHIGCSSASTTFIFQTLSAANSSYWAERWELYKYSYAIAIWAWSKGVNMIEFYNEPDLYLGSCLTAENFKHYYFVRSLSIQNAYSDFNSLVSATSRVNINIVASGFARITYGGNTTRYLGDVCVQNRNYMFDTDTNSSSWTNMHSYSYHSYGKIGEDMYKDLLSLTESVNNDTRPAINSIPVIVTEHNAHTSSEWDTLTTTSDDPLEASRLASQIMYLAYGKITSLYVFKFSITPSFSANREVAKNGIHWGEIYNSPFDISDTTLSAEAMRLLMKMTGAQIYTTTNSDTSKYRTYLGSKNDDGRFYFYVVNDKNDYINLQMDLTQWNITTGSQIIVETVDSRYYGECELTSAPAVGTRLSVILSPFSTNRLTIHSEIQNTTTTYANLACTARAGTLSSQTDCSSSSLFVGTSITSNHDNTSVALVQFPVNANIGANQRTLLKINVEDILGTADSTLLILGLLNASATWDSTSASWNSLSSSSSGLNVLTRINSTTVIDTIYENFINWPSSSNLVVVGHVTATYGVRNQTRLIDVSDYFESAVKSGLTQITFLFYRPFRHPSYTTSIGPMPSDDLSFGSIVKFSSLTSSKPVELNHYWRATATTTSTSTTTAPATTASVTTTMTTLISAATNPSTNAAASITNSSTVVTSTLPPSTNTASATGGSPTSSQTFVAGSTTGVSPAATTNISSNGTTSASVNLNTQTTTSSNAAIVNAVNIWLMATLVVSLLK